MISKRLVTGAEAHDRPTTILLDVHSRGVDRAQFNKLASVEPAFYSDIQTVPGKSFVHMISLGAGEYYGFNNNADFFNEKSGSVTFPHPKDKACTGAILADGLRGHHKSFVKHAHVYREHVNSRRGGTPQGEVVKELYNPMMHRGELVLCLDNEKWATELQDLSQGKPVNWSMGCGVPYDTCTACGNKAPTAEQYCDHIKYAKLQILDDGTQVGMINDQPCFHDMSQVRSPADRICFALGKVASGQAVDPATQPEAMWLPLSVIRSAGTAQEQKNAAMVEKLSEIEKQLPLAASHDVSFGAPSIGNDTIKELQRFPLGDVLHGLGNRKVMLPPQDMLRITLKKSAAEIYGLDDLPCQVLSVFSSLKAAGDFEAISDASYLAPSNRFARIDQIAEKLATDFSMDPVHVRRRALQQAISPTLNMRRPNIRHLLSQKTAGAELLAREYAKYQLAFLNLAGAGTNAHAQLPKLLVLHNRTV